MNILYIVLFSLAVCIDGQPILVISDLIQGEPGSVSCTTDDGIVSIYNKADTITRCIAPSTSCIFNSPSITNWTGIYTLTKGETTVGTYKFNVTVNILQVSTQRDGGLWTCKGFGVSNVTNTVDVKVPVTSVTIQPTNSVFIDGESNTVACITSGTPNPLPTFKWYKDGQLLSGTTSTLNYLADKDDNDKILLCSADNIYSGTKTSQLILDIKYGPITTVSPESINVKEYDTLTIKCTVQSNPAPTSIRWYNPDGTEITDPQSLITSTSNRKDLIISMINRNQSGVYRCEGRNTLTPTSGPPELRSNNKTTTVVVHYRPDTPHQLKIQSQSNNQICVEWKPGFNGGATQTFIVQHSSDDKTWVDSSPIPDRNDGQLIQYCITDLESETQYYIILTASNTFGDSKFVYYTSNIVKTIGDKVTSGESEEYSKGRASGIGIGMCICVGVVLLVVVSVFIYKHRGKKKGTNTDENYSTLNRGTASGEPPTYQELNNVRTYENLGRDTDTNIDINTGTDSTGTGNTYVIT